jgi:hypothetical protein
MLLAATPASQADELATLSVEKLLWDSKERLLSLRLTLQGGRIVALRELPAQWEIKVDNSSSAKGIATLEAQNAMPQATVTRQQAPVRRVHVTQRDFVLRPAPPLGAPP